MARVIKPAEVFVWDVKKPTVHGSQPKQDASKALGALRRMREKPGQHQRRKP